MTPLPTAISTAWPPYVAGSFTKAGIQKNGTPLLLYRVQNVQSRKNTRSGPTAFHTLQEHTHQATSHPPWAPLHHPHQGAPHSCNPGWAGLVAARARMTQENCTGPHPTLPVHSRGWPGRAGRRVAAGVPGRCVPGVPARSGGPRAPALRAPGARAPPAGRPSCPCAPRSPAPRTGWPSRCPGTAGSPPARRPHSSSSLAATALPAGQPTRQARELAHPEEVTAAPTPTSHPPRRRSVLPDRWMKVPEPSPNPGQKSGN